jgi:Domain of unknown function (DUF4148)
MNTRKFMLALAAFVGGNAALAQSPHGLTRAEVRAEAIAARDAGLIEVGENAGLRQLMSAPSLRSRAEVRAEAVAANQARARSSSYEDGTQLDRQLTLPSTLQRAQVRAEAIEALRLGLIGRGDGEPRLPTPAELESIRQAGLRAIGMENVAQR